MSVRSWVGGLPVDLAPLRTSRDFRLLFWAGTVFYLGGMVSYVAVPYLLYSLTRSNFAVGALGVAELVPLLFFGLYGGALADAVDRRLMVLWSSAAQVGLTVLLMLNAFLPAPRVWARLRSGRPAVRRAVAAAPVQGGTDPPHGGARAAAGRRRAVLARHPAGAAGRSGCRGTAAAGVRCPVSGGASRSTPLA